MHNHMKQRYKYYLKMKIKICITLYKITKQYLNAISKIKHAHEIDNDSLFFVGNYS